MAREIHIVSKPSQGRVDPNAVPEDVKVDVEDTYAALGGDKSKAAQIVFADKAELNTFVKQARTYCENRTRPTSETDDTPVPAPLVFRKVPRKGAPDNILTFAVNDPETDES